MTTASPGALTTATDTVTVDHWFDFICPYCYVAQDRNRVLRERGVRVVDHALQIHPEIGPGGVVAGPRSGPAYEHLAREAEAAGLALRWTDRVPYSRPALAAAEWVRENCAEEVAERFRSAVFAEYFAEGRNIESHDLLAELAERAGADGPRLRVALGGAAKDALARSEGQARVQDVTGTPAWVTGAGRISGLRPRAAFAQWADAVLAGN